MVHLHRHSMDEDYIEVVDSCTFCQFARKYLVKPGPKSGIERRTFYDMDDSAVQGHRDKVSIIKYPIFVFQNCIIFRLEV